jgi:hypothetical protein
MILPNGVQPWLACDTLTVTYAMTVPWFDGKNVVASDGKMLVVIPVTECEDDYPGPIPIDAMKEAFKYSKGGRGANYVLTLKKEYVQTITGKQFPRWGDKDVLRGQQFPHYQSIVADADKLNRTVRVGFNAQQLLAAAKAGGQFKKDAGLFVYLSLCLEKDGSVDKVMDVEAGDSAAIKSKILVMPVKKK